MAGASIWKWLAPAPPMIMEPQRHRYAFINLPHAQTILNRLVRWFETQTEPCPSEETGVPERLAQIDRLLRPYVEDPAEAEAVRVADAVASEARSLVVEIERVGYRGDRLGQCIRNLFECLGLAEEGAELSLVCGERPDSPLRP